MKDKYFDTVRDRFDVHRRQIARDVEYLEYIAYDHAKTISPDFVVQIEALKTALKRMEELLEEPQG